MNVQPRDVMKRNVFQLPNLHCSISLYIMNRQIRKTYPNCDLSEWYFPFELKCVVLPRLERVLERSMMVCLLGLLRTERLAREMSAVTRVMDILKQSFQFTNCY